MYKGRINETAPESSTGVCDTVSFPLTNLCNRIFYFSTLVSQQELLEIGMSLKQASHDVEVRHLSR